MFSEGSRFMPDINEVTGIYPEEKDDEVSRSAKSRPKRENVRT